MVEKYGTKGVGCFVAVDHFDQVLAGSCQFMGYPVKSCMLTGRCFFLDPCAALQRFPRKGPGAQLPKIPLRQLFQEGGCPF